MVALSEVRMHLMVDLAVQNVRITFHWYTARALKVRGLLGMRELLLGHLLGNELTFLRLQIYLSLMTLRSLKRLVPFTWMCLRRQLLMDWRLVS